ncbi:MAG: sugar phosphate isomerase/epimerase [Armatimonadetes bacterium]|nr:sugar phosphate isomerase/epimerase [Armatimonadota bacterium]MDW8121053.1 sugar phosphate isomerase/epimerase family protein [Armatimonadota bacterium]
MNLAIITDEVSQDLARVVDWALERGVKGLELRSVWGKGPHLLDDREVQRIHDLIKGTGLIVCSIASPFLKCDFDRSQYEEHLSILKRCAEMAKVLGAPLIRGFTFWRQDPGPSFEEIAAHLREPAAMLGEEGLILGIENEPSTMATNGRKVRIVLDLLNSPYARAVWDPGNDVFDPEREKPYPDGYETVKDLIGHIHIKDGVWHSEENRFEAVPVGEGEVDYHGQFRALKTDGYKGWISLETHYRPQKPLDERLAQMPRGEEFSYLGDEASDLCLRNLRRILEEVGVVEEH